MPVETFGIENTEAEEYKNNRSDDNSTVKDVKKVRFYSFHIVKLTEQNKTGIFLYDSMLLIFSCNNQLSKTIFPLQATIYFSFSTCLLIMFVGSPFAD